VFFFSHQINELLQNGTNKLKNPKTELIISNSKLKKSIKKQYYLANIEGAFKANSNIGIKLNFSFGSL
jgi:hypothetical protein